MSDKNGRLPESQDKNDEIVPIEDNEDEFDEPRRRRRLFRERYVELSEEELDALDDEDEDERDYRPIRMRRDSKTGCLGGLMYAGFVISISVVLACLAWMAASDVLALNKAEHTATVSIPQDFNIDYVADALKDAGIIEYKFLFKLFSSISNAEENIRPGEYVLSTNFDYRALVSKMRTGSSAQLTTKITFPEGFTIQQMFELLEDNGIANVDDLIESATNSTFTYPCLEDENIAKGDPKRLEGYLFPSTYEFYIGERPSSVINKFLLAFHNRLTVDMYDQAEALGLSLREAVIVASMIEREAANDEERPIIASVIYNRLKSNMQLGIDATIIYVLPEHKTSLSSEDLAIDSPYNTRKYTGLPPGPIANPGMASITAALKPSTTNYYYYALDTATGTHRFFTNATEHGNFTATQNYG